MKDKILYLIGTVVMPIAFLACIPLALLDGLREAWNEVAYDTRLNWRTLVSFYRDGFPRRSTREASHGKPS